MIIHQTAINTATKIYAETRLHLGLFSLHAADVGDIASNGVFAAQAPPCAWPAAVGYWRFSGGDSSLIACLYS